MSTIPASHLAPLVMSIALCTTAIGLLLFAFVGGVRHFSREALFAGIFTLLYGARLLANWRWATASGLSPGSLAFIHSSLEYLVPAAGAFLFASYLGRRWYRVNLAIAGCFSLLAIVAIPFELVTGRPYALKSCVDALVLSLLAGLLLNLAMPSDETTTSERAVLRYCAGVFGVFVLNEHLHFVRGVLVSEPVGFLIFVLGIAYVIMRRAVLDRARVSEVEGELATARKIQLATLPRAIPDVRGLDISVRYLPAAEVAGDFYHFIHLDDGRFAVFIADVSGHGVPAALVAAMLKTAVGAHAASAASPARLMRELNLLFCGNLDRQFITASCTCIDTAAGTITYASAGHPPALIESAGSIGELHAEGVVLGRFRNAAYEERTASFRPGDALVLYTDGITEAQLPGDEAFGEEGLHAALRASTERPAAGRSDAIVAALNRATLRDERYEDDVTLIVVQHVATVSTAVAS